jgi:hypothetical protein
MAQFDLEISRTILIEALQALADEKAQKARCARRHKADNAEELERQAEALILAGRIVARNGKVIIGE